MFGFPEIWYMHRRDCYNEYILNRPEVSTWLIVQLSANYPLIKLEFDRMYFEGESSIHIDFMVFWYV